MIRFIHKSIPLLAALTLLAGCSGSASPTSVPSASVSTSPSSTPTSASIPPKDTPSPIASPTSSAEVTPQASSDALKEQVQHMSLKEKIGQLLIVGIEGTESNEDIRDLIINHHVGGMIFFKPNVATPSQALTLVNDLKAINKTNSIPLWLSIDEEGGRVSRMPAELNKLPTNKRIGQANNTTLSHEIGVILGKELSGFGFNINFAPVMDVNSNPDNPVIGDRSFSDQAEIVSRLGISTMEGLTSQHILPVIKHFPGHGDTAVDSHIGLPVITHDIDRLHRLELVPFKDAIQQGADAVMVAHILLPKLDAEYPSSLSKPIITDLLRQELGFEGVVFTDDLTMGAITENYTLGEAAVLSILAGADIALVCHEYENALSVIDALEQAVADNRITMERLDESVIRILALKQKYGLSDKAAAGPNVQQINQDITELLNKYLP